MRGTVGKNLLENARQLISGLNYNFRFQPFFLYAMLLAAGIHFWNILRQNFDTSQKTVSIGLMLLAAGFLAFLIQETTVHLNYYVPLVPIAMLLFAAALPILRRTAVSAQKTMIVILFLLLANNLLFVAAKTWTVWKNRDLLNPAPMRAFLAVELNETNRCVLPPGLWLYAEQRRLNFRANFIPVIGQPQPSYQAYLKSLLDWQPDIIILDRGDAAMRPDRYFDPAQLAAAGYVEQARFDRVFRDRILYDGYRLVVYRRAGNLPK